MKKILSLLLVLSLAFTLLGCNNSKESSNGDDLSKTRL